MNRIRALARVVLPALVFSAGSAIAGSDASTIGDLMSSLARATHRTAHFEERRYLAALDRPLELSGTLAFVPPDRLEKTTLVPHQEKLVVQGGRLTIDRETEASDPSEPQIWRHQSVDLTDHPEIAAFIESIRGTMAGDEAVLRRFYDIAADGNAERWQLHLVPREEVMRKAVTAIEIAGTGGQITRITIEEATGDRSVMTVFPEQP